MLLLLLVVVVQSSCSHYLSRRYLDYAVQVYNTTQTSTCIHTGLRINPLIPELFADPFLLG